MTSIYDKLYISGLNTLSTLDTTMVVKWFRDFALERRLGHIVECIEREEWPVGKSYSAYTGCLGMDLDVPLYETIKRLSTQIPIEIDTRRSASSTPDIITITTDNSQIISKNSQTSISTLAPTNITPVQAANQNIGTITNATSNMGTSKKRKRHIAIDVETERAKLHALLNNSQSPGEYFQNPIE